MGSPWGYDGIWITRSKMIQAWQGGQARGSTFLELKELAFQSEGASNRAAQQQHTAVPGWFLDGFWMVSGWFLDGFWLIRVETVLFLIIGIIGFLREDQQKSMVFTIVQ